MRKYLLFIPLITLFVACNAAPEPTATLAPTNTNVPTNIPQPSPTVSLTLEPPPTESPALMEDVTPPPGLELYRNPEFSFSIAYFPDWELQEDFMGTVVVFLSPQENSADQFRDNINIVVEDLGAVELDLDEYIELSTTALESLITDFDLLESHDLDLAGVPAKEIIFTGSQGVFELKWWQVYLIKNDQAYVITFTAEADFFDDYIEFAEDMVASFSTQ